MLTGIETPIFQELAAVVWSDDERPLGLLRIQYERTPARMLEQAGPAFMAGTKPGKPRATQ